MALARQGLALLASEVSPYKVNGLRFLTALHYQSSLIKIANNMTFFYDPNWSGLGNTLPLVFFYVKDFKELMESEVSQKSLLFYNSQETNNSDAVKGSLLGVVSDNIINKPKKYQMDILLPTNASKYMEQYQFDPYYNVGNFSAEPKESSDFNDVAQDLSNTIYKAGTIVANISLDIVRSLIKALDSESILTASMQQLLTDTQTDSNKASLEAMWENRTIIKMKLWNGWKYAYVAIENCQISKKGDEDGFYEASLTLTELPIMAVNRDTVMIDKPDITYLSGAVEKAMKGTLVKEAKTKIDKILNAFHSLGDDLDFDNVSFGD